MFKEKICGLDLVPELCRVVTEKEYSVFILKAAEKVATKAAKVMQDKYKELKIVGTYSLPFGFEKDECELAKINEMLLEIKADMLIVGMVVPKQDIFIYENMAKYQISMSFSICGTIDFVAGEQKRAPKWVNKIDFK